MFAGVRVADVPLRSETPLMTEFEIVTVEPERALRQTGTSDDDVGLGHTCISGVRDGSNGTVVERHYRNRKDVGSDRHSADTGYTGDRSAC